MATTFVDYTGDGNSTKSFSFPSTQQSDIKVDVNGVTKTSGVHYNITSYTTTGGGSVVFTSGNIPASPATIRIRRDTDVDVAKATYTAGSSLKAADLNANNEQLLFRLQEQTQPLVSDDITDGSVTTSKIAADNITSALIADDQINSEHYVDGSIDTAHIADSQITTAKIAADAINSDKLADNAIGSEHYQDASIANDKLVNLTVTGAKIAAATISTDKLEDNSVTSAKINNDAVTTAKIADSELKTLAGM